MYLVCFIIYSNYNACTNKIHPHNDPFDNKCNMFCQNVLLTCGGNPDYIYFRCRIVNLPHSKLSLGIFAI